MTKIKFCGLSRPSDMEAAAELCPDYIGFVFAEKSSRYVSPETAKELKRMLPPDVKAVGVFVNECPEAVAKLLNDNVIDIAQLHGEEDENYIRQLRQHTGKPIIKAFVVRSADDIRRAVGSSADHILLDGGMGEGKSFNRRLLKEIKRPYFLAGGLTPDNVADAVTELRPFAVDVSSGIETDGVKNKTKMAAFTAAVRKEDRI